MRILTVRQPWAWAIIHGGKNVENRVRNIAGSYRGPVAIHAGLAYDHGSHVESQILRKAQDDAAVADGAELYAGGYMWDVGKPDPRRLWSVPGAVIGVVDLVDVHVVQQSHSGANVCFDDHTPTGGICSEWAHAFDEFPAYRGHHLVLANPRPLAEPIPFKGALGLRKLDDETIALIEAGLS